MTKPGENQLSCSVSSEFSCRYSVRWLLNGQHYPGAEARQEWKNLWNCIRTVTFSPSSRGQDPNREDLFTCEVKRDFDRDVKLFNLNRQLEGETLINKANPSHSVMMLKFCLFFSFLSFLFRQRRSNTKTNHVNCDWEQANHWGGPWKTSARR